MSVIELTKHIKRVFSSRNNSDNTRSQRIQDFQQKGMLLDQYITNINIDLKILSIFDDIRYDRADLDVITGPMREHAIRKLRNFGFIQINGSILENAHRNLRIIIPKSHTLGASPFDATRYTKKRDQDLYMLTPTQAACQIIDQCYPCDAVDRIKNLIACQPINILRILDFLERKPAHAIYRENVRMFRDFQKEVITNGSPKHQRPLG